MKEGIEDKTDTRKAVEMAKGCPPGTVVATEGHRGFPTHCQAAGVPDQALGGGVG